MSIRTLNYAAAIDAPDPLCKLILQYAGDVADEATGHWRLRSWDRLVRFCCASSFDVGTAMGRLMSAGLISECDEPEVYALAGYEPPDDVRVAPSYQKRVLSKSLRVAILERDGHACRVCAATNDLTIDHIVAERLGGTHSKDNLQTLCRSCNSKKGWRKP